MTVNNEERAAVITIGGKKYELLLTTKATKDIAARYGGLEKLGETLLKQENFEMALDEIIYLITLMANQSILVHNLKNPSDKRDLLNSEDVELLTTPLELSDYKDAIMAAMLKGTKRTIESAESSKNAPAAE